MAGAGALRFTERMAPYDDLLLRVHAAWNGCPSAHVRIANIRDLHWRRPAGAPRPLLHAYIACPDIVSGTIPHACDPETAPHRILVCILKRHAMAGAYEMLASRAGVPFREPVDAWPVAAQGRA
jgi:hypothetical protein